MKYDIEKYLFKYCSAQDLVLVLKVIFTMIEKLFLSIYQNGVLQERRFV